MVSCQKGPTRHANARQIGPFWQDTLDVTVVPMEQMRFIAVLVTLLFEFLVSSGMANDVFSLKWKVIFSQEKLCLWPVWVYSIFWINHWNECFGSTDEGFWQQ